MATRTRSQDRYTQYILKTEPTAWLWVTADHFKELEPFLDKAPLQDINQKDQDGNTPLHLAVQNSSMHADLAVIQWFFKKEADIQATNKDGNTPLHLAALSHSPLAIIQALVKAKADIHAKNKNGDTPLHLVALSGSSLNHDEKKYLLRLALDNIKFLLHYGADIQATNNQGKKPVDLAHSPAIRQLLRDYKPAHQQEQTPVTPAQ